jgi:peptide/nickel transport system permease protein
MKGLFKLLSSNPKAMFGLGIIIVFILAAVFAPLITQYEPDKRTGNPHEYPAFVVKAAQDNPDGWIAKNLATNKRTLLMSKDADHVLGTSRMGRSLRWPSRTTDHCDRYCGHLLGMGRTCCPCTNLID